jgi:hypothetical protein
MGFKCEEFHHIYARRNSNSDHRLLLAQKLRATCEMRGESGRLIGMRAGPGILRAGDRQPFLDRYEAWQVR